MIDIDGAYGEGGGQLVRTAVALSAITGTPIRVHDVRAKRERPGLAPQHLAAVRAVAAVCAAECAGLDLRCRAFTFVPRSLHGGEHVFDVGTAGSVTLVAQALLPALACADGRSRVKLIGGTDVRAAPPLDHFRHVLLPLLGAMGVEVACRVARRGYYPRGGGEIELEVAPGRLRSPALDAPRGGTPVEGLAHVASLPADIAGRMRAAALGRLGGLAARIDTAILGPAEASGPGGAIVLWTRSAPAALGAGRVAARGIRAEALGDEAGAELAADIAAGAQLDVHTADQSLVYLALAGEGAFTTRAVTRHATTAMWLIEQLLPVRFEVGTAGALARIEVRRR